MQDEIEFIEGQRDCMDGIPHDESMSLERTRGYAEQYAADECEVDICLTPDW